MHDRLLWFWVCPFLIFNIYLIYENINTENIKVEVYELYCCSLASWRELHVRETAIWWQNMDACREQRSKNKRKPWKVWSFCQALLMSYLIIFFYFTVYFSPMANSSLLAPHYCHSDVNWCQETVMFITWQLLLFLATINSSFRSLEFKENMCIHF